LKKPIHVKLIIDGKWTSSTSGEEFSIINPATEEVVATACRANAEDTQSAIDAAQRGFHSWREIVPWERSKVLRKAAALMTERRDGIAEWMTIECGKPIGQAVAEVNASIDYVEWYSDEARRIYSKMLQGRDTQTVFQAIYEPIGVTACFTAWNFPAVLPIRKIAPALAAGCSVVCRPSEAGSICAAELIKCFVDAGLPPGTINLLTGPSGVISDHILQSPVVRKASFTGSVPVGKSLIAKSADTVKKMTMELGGHAPVIIFDDIDPEKLAQSAVAAKFRNNGQVCASPTRFFVHRSIVEKFTEAFVKTAAGLKLGNGLEPDTDVGPLINERRRSAVETLVETTMSEGGKILLGGKRPENFKKGFFYEPTVFVDVTDDMTIMKEEPFGPLALITSFDGFDEVIERANSTEYGLASYVFTHSLELVHRTVAALDAGIVSVNNWVVSTAEMPYGGVKYSGFGREGGSDGIKEYLTAKFVNCKMRAY